MGIQKTKIQEKNIKMMHEKINKCDRILEN